MASSTSFEARSPGIDASISQASAFAYWSSISADNHGMLGGFPQISRIDLQGSANFVAKLRCRRAAAIETHKGAGVGGHGNGEDPRSSRLGRVIDCGAGIGRVTGGLLCSVSEIVDVLEPVEKFARAITSGPDFAALRAEGRIGHVYNVGIEEWAPPAEAYYDLMWHQWCLSQLNDDQVVDYLGRCRAGLKEDGWFVAKENMSTDIRGDDNFHEQDSSVTRADAKFRALFEKAGFKIVATELQKGFPRVLFPVRIYALQPREKTLHKGQDQRLCD